MELFSFGDDKKVRVLGIDENGFGPIIGPMIVSGVLLRSPDSPFVYLDMRNLNLPRGLADSKKVFTRSVSSYSLGEIVALSILRISGKPANTLSHLIDAVVVGGLDRLRHSPLMGALDLELELPVWAKFVDDGELRKWFEVMEIEIEDVKVEAVSAPEFNHKLADVNSKSKLDFFYFMHLMRELPDFDMGMCGKIGGTKYYTGLFEENGIHVEVIRELRTMSSYRTADGREIHFILNGDDKFLPIAMASLIGKYLRELFMLQINRKFGHDEPIPWASGYRHDRKTFDLLQQMTELFERHDVEREK